MAAQPPMPGMTSPPTNFTVLIFIKSLAAPVVLFSENPVSLYEEIKRHIQQASPSSPKLLEKPGAGPLKKVCFLDTEISGVALQSELGAGMGPGPR
jgi:hypothetical protein